MSYVQPSRGDVHVNRPLTNISVAHMQRASKFVASQVFPRIRVEKQSDTFFEYPRGEFNRDSMRERAPGTESAGGTYRVSQDTYFSRVYAFHMDVSDQVRANQDSPLNLDREATRFLTLKGMLRKEIDWVNTFLKTDVWTFEAAGADVGSTSFSLTHATNNKVVFWDDSDSTPIEDVRTFKRAVLQSTGFEPNTLTLGREVYDVLVDHPDIVARLDRGQTTGPAMANKDALAALFEVSRVLVMDAIQNTGKEGQSDVHSFIAGKRALLSYRPAVAGLLTPSAGYTFGWTFGGTGNMGTRMKRFRMEHLESDRIEIEMAFDHKVISQDLGCYIHNIVQ